MLLFTQADHNPHVPENHHHPVTAVRGQWGVDLTVSASPDPTQPYLDMADALGASFERTCSSLPRQAVPEARGLIRVVTPHTTISTTFHACWSDLLMWFTHGADTVLVVPDFVGSLRRLLPKNLLG